jgi:hypothetical protein
MWGCEPAQTHRDMFLSPFDIGMAPKGNPLR